MQELGPNLRILTAMSKAKGSIDLTVFGDAVQKSFNKQ